MLRYRPHHFLCTLGFQGHGYSEEFVRAFARIARDLERSPEGDATIIEVATEADAICEACPDRREKSCASAAKIEALDTAHARILGLKAGDRLTWGEAKARLARQMRQELFDEACAPCPWKSLGACETALKRLQGRSE
ncbi:MAG: DUF1284 domain-containing protein [Oligoflexia bacterium]|nr:DUF1284 domain-containing protein [Oligoflexia bacterium]